MNKAISIMKTFFIMDITPDVPKNIENTIIKILPIA